MFLLVYILVNNAILKVSPPEESKSCFPDKSSDLKLEHIADDIAIINLLVYGVGEGTGILTVPSV